MKLATSTATDRTGSPSMYLPEHVPARAINMLMPACAAIAERDNPCGENTGKSGSKKP